MKNEKAIALRSSRVPEFLAHLVHSNQFLKMFSFLAFVLSIVSMLSLTYQISKDPVILAFSSDGGSLSQAPLPRPEDQIEEGIKAYLHYRYHWDKVSVAEQFKESESFVNSPSLKAFRSTAQKISNFSKEKGVSQKIFPEKFKIDLHKKIAQISGERITTIQGLRASGSLNLELEFSFGERTEKNPWGIYINKEKEIQ